MVLDVCSVTLACTAKGATQVLAPHALLRHPTTQLDALGAVGGHCYGMHVSNIPLSARSPVATGFESFNVLSYNINFIIT